MRPSAKAAARSVSDNSSTASGGAGAAEVDGPGGICAAPAVAAAAYATRNSRLSILGAHFCLLKIALGLEAFKIPRYARDREDTAAAPIGHRAIARVQRTIDVSGIPGFRVADIIDREVVMLASKERD